MKKLCGVILALAMVFCLVGCDELVGGRYEQDAIGAAESYAVSQFRKDIGLAADEVESEVFYRGTDYSDNEIALVAVWCYFEDGSTPIGAYCVYTMNGVRINATEMLPPGYDFEDNLQDLKALFGIVDKD